ncbi:hypothetical protein ACVIHI_003470 [Bradyrhizobium sp. USDA 4524]|uniref:hypothetical protein n=1 Tax=unclassified Bradyrhizobium TaxID=2631580 RepID=UPI00209E5D8C|nr:MULTISPECIES: hypothetical protein [unclassified Bradyrhizobium]MCP1843612.1 hypothetical protein [Bradyrhizobium sp. USDA 4538]MCP1904178.1 hypothetical protein [Bradyrhizobium sp. USDA 4537]MCP1990166.1 hypothetical protein [Bradyrhizobium sp. USDA 4539]
MNRDDVFESQPGTTRRRPRISDGGRDAQALRFEGSIGRRTVGVHGVIKGFAAADCFGVGIEEACSGRLCSVEARFPMLGTAVFACELARLLRSTVDLGRLKLSRHGQDCTGNPSQLVPAEGIEPPTFSLQNRGFIKNMHDFSVR